MATTIVDAHVHLMPERLFRAVRGYYRSHLWHTWHEYDQPSDALLTTLDDAGAMQVVFGSYAHRSGMAQSLNFWAANVQRTFAGFAFGCGTVHPDDEDISSLAREALEGLGLLGVRVNPRAGRFRLDDPRLDGLYRTLIEAGRPLIVHMARRPEPSEAVGARALERLLRRFPNLQVLVPHLGADEFEAFFDLCAHYEYLYLGTGMVFNQHLGGPPPLERVIEFQDRVVYGSGFPLIPYRWDSALGAIRSLHLGTTIETKVLSMNATRLFSLDRTGAVSIETGG